MSEYKTLRQIVNQLCSCNYTCEAGRLENNLAFIALTEMADRAEWYTYFADISAKIDDAPTLAEKCLIAFRCINFVLKVKASDCAIDHCQALVRNMWAECERVARVESGN